MELLRNEVLPHSQYIPHQFILRVVMLLNKGSIHSATSTIGGKKYFFEKILIHFIIIIIIINNNSINFLAEKNNELKLREEFAKTCFETLLQFSLLDGLNNEIESTAEGLTEKDEGGVAGRLAVTALLHRFQEVLKRFIEDERRSGKCPLPR